MPPFNEYKYGAVPPLTPLTVIVVRAPYLVIVPLVTVALTIDGCIIVMVDVRITPFESDIVNVCVPANFENLPMPVYGAVPPLAVTVTNELSPLQLITVGVAVMVNAADGWVIVIDLLVTQLLESFTYTTCTPANTEVNEEEA